MQAALIRARGNSYAQNSHLIPQEVLIGFLEVHLVFRKIRSVHSTHSSRHTQLERLTPEPFFLFLLFWRSESVFNSFRQKLIL